MLQDRDQLCCFAICPTCHLMEKKSSAHSVDEPEQVKDEGKQGGRAQTERALQLA